MIQGPAANPTYIEGVLTAAGNKKQKRAVIIKVSRAEQSQAVPCVEKLLKMPD